MDKKMESGAYSRLLLMLLLSFVVMYAVMFFNVDKLNHIYLSITRAYMALLMVTPMAVMMILLMKKMYSHKRKNILIIVSSVLVFVLSVLFLRAQTAIKDIQYMKAMIPHHSSAILTSKNAEINDPEVKELSKQIVNSQEEEIAQMKAILERMEK